MSDNINSYLFNEVETFTSFEDILTMSSQNEQLMKEKVTKVNWDELIITWMGPNLIERFFNISEKTELNDFIDGLQYEYGLNNKKKDLQIAYEKYLHNAKHTQSWFCMYRIFLIHYLESEEFQIQSDNVIQMFYLFKVFVYTPSPKYADSYYFEIYPENVVRHWLNSFENGWQRFDAFFNLLKMSSKYKTLIEGEDLDFIKLSVEITLERDEDYIIPKDMATEDKPELMFKLAKSVNNTDPELSLVLLESCFEQKYYRAGLEYAFALVRELDMKERACEILLESYIGMNYTCVRFLYLLKLNLLDYSNEQNLINGLLGLLDYLFDAVTLKNDIIMDEAFSVVHFLKKRKVPLSEKYINYINELVDYVLSKTDSKNEYIFLCLTQLYGYDVCDKVKVDLPKALSYAKKAFELTANDMGMSRACYGMAYEIEKKLYKQGKLSKQELIKSAKEYLRLIEHNVELCRHENINGSITYAGAKLRELIYGKENDFIMQMKYYEMSSKAQYSWCILICHRRKAKSKKKLQEDEMFKYLMKLEEEDKLAPPVVKDSKAKRESNLLKVECEICRNNNLEIVLVPCLHKCCKECYNNFQNEKCPFCRINIERYIDI